MDIVENKFWAWCVFHRALEKMNKFSWKQTFSAVKHELKCEKSHQQNTVPTLKKIFFKISADGPIVAIFEYIIFEAFLDKNEGNWIPHIWVEVDDFPDPIIDIHSIGGQVFTFCHDHGIEPHDQQKFAEIAKAKGCKNPELTYRELMVCGGIPTATKCNTISP